jgi:hypothetical protein
MKKYEIKFRAVSRNETIQNEILYANLFSETIQNEISHANMFHETIRNEISHVFCFAKSPTYADRNFKSRPRKLSYLLK